MTILIDIVAFITWILLSMGFGWFEGCLFHYRWLPTQRYDNYYATHVNYHFNFTFIRILAATLFFVPYALSLQYFGDNVLLSVFFMLAAFILSLPYFHDGQYYCTRNDLYEIVYPMRWRDNTTQSDAFFNFNYQTRLIMFITSIFVLIFKHILL